MSLLYVHVQKLETSLLIVAGQKAFHEMKLQKGNSHSRLGGTPTSPEIPSMYAILDPV